MERWWTEVPADEWSDAIVAAMKLGGVDNLFFVSGSELTFYQEAIAKAAAKRTPAPRLIGMTHENVALNAALGNAMARNKPAATAVHVDAGTLHYGAAIHTAWRGGYPVLMTAGTAPRAFPGSMRGARNGGVQYFQEARDQGEIVRQYTKMDHRMESLDNPGLMVTRLLQIAMSEPKGPVYLSIPQEVAATPLPGHAHFPALDEMGIARPSFPDPADAKEIATWLVHAENPLFSLGGVGRDSRAVEEIVRLAELLAVPVTEPAHADRMNFPGTHWAYETGPSAKDADVLVVFEDAIPFTPGEGAPPPETKIAWISADPVLSRFKTREFRADLWLSASGAAVAASVYEEATKLLNQSDLHRIADRRAHLEANRHEIDARQTTLAEEDLKSGRLTGRLVGYMLGGLLEPDAVLMNDALGSSSFVRHYAKRSRAGTTYRSGSTSGGWGSGAAFGVKLARPDSDVVHATGDGYFMFGTPLASLLAASHYKAAYLAVVFVNGSYSTGTSGLRTSYPEGYAVSSGNYEGGSFDPPPNFAKLGEAANGYGEEVTSAADLEPALRRGLEMTRDNVPAVIAVHVPGPLQEQKRG